MKLKKKITKEGKELTRTERHFGVVLENIDSKLDLVVEGQQVLDKKIDKVDGKLEEFKEEVNYKFGVVQETLKSHSEILKSHSEILKSHSEILKSHSEILKSHSEDLGIIKTDIEFIKNSLKRKVDLEEFEALEKRVAFLESKVR